MNLKQACVIGLFWAAGAGAIALPSKPARAEQGGAQQGGGQQSEGVAAVVNDEVISTFDVRRRSALILASSGIPTSAEAMRQVRGQALRSLVDEHLQVQEAKDKKIKVEKGEVDRALENIAQQNNTTVEKFSKQLEAAGAGVATLKAQIQAELLWRRLINARYGSRVRVSNAEIQVTLDRIKANATKPQFDISEILLPAESEKDFQDAQTAAQRLLQEMVSGRANFAAVARQFSAAPSAAAGGDLGWMSETDLRPELLQVAHALKPGQISVPIRTTNGVEIIALRGARAGVDPKTAVRVKLRQASAPNAARDQLDRVRLRVQGCDGLEKAIHTIKDAAVVDLGDTAEADLADDVRERVASTAAGAATALFPTKDGVGFIAVCARDTAQGLLPSRTEIEDRLYEDEIALLSQRYLMDLRREGTIITR